jgi:hypothetical protein
LHGCLQRNGWRPLRVDISATRNPCFHHLITCAIWQWRVSWKMNVTLHMLWNIFHLDCKNESHYGELSFCANLVSPCAYVCICVCARARLSSSIQ